MISTYEKFLNEFEDEMEKNIKIIEKIKERVNDIQDNNHDQDDEENLIIDSVIIDNEKILLKVREMSEDMLKNFQFCYNKDLSENKSFGNNKAVFNFLSEENDDNFSFQILSTYLSKKGFKIINKNYGIYHSSDREEAEKILMEMGLRKNDDLINEFFSEKKDRGS